MVAFEAFIVITDNSSTRIAIEQSIFVVMGAPWHGFGNTPDHHFDNSPVVEQESIAVDQFRIHVGNYANIFECNPAVKPSVNCDSSVGVLNDSQPGRGLQPLGFLCNRSDNVLTSRCTVSVSGMGTLT